MIHLPKVKHLFVPEKDNCTQSDFTIVGHINYRALDIYVYVSYIMSVYYILYMYIIGHLNLYPDSSSMLQSLICFTFS